MLEKKLEEQPKDRRGLIAGLKKTLQVGYINSVLYGMAMPLSWFGVEMANNGHRPGLAALNYLMFSFGFGYSAYNGLGIIDTKLSLRKQNDYLNLESNFD